MRQLFNPLAGMRTALLMKPSRAAILPGAVGMQLVAILLLVACTTAPPAPTSAPAGAAPAAPTSEVAGAQAPAGAPAAASPATAPAAQPSGPIPDQIVIASLGDPTNYDPLLASLGEGQWRARLMFDTLVELDGATFEPRPRLAKSWEISPDGLTYTFELVENAMWQDGAPVTAEDVAFTAYMILHPDYTGAYRTPWMVLEGADSVVNGTATQIPSISVVDTNTISFKLAQPYAPFLALAAANLVVIPKHLLEGTNPKDMLQTDFYRKPVGSGPYKFVSYVRNQDFIVEANDSYWGGAPLVKRITHRVIADSQSLALALETGEAQASLYPVPSQAARLSAKPNLEVMRVPFSYPEGAVFNMKDPVTGNKAIRQAVLLGVDSQTFAERFLDGLGKPGAGPVAPGLWAYNSNIQPNPYDPARARQMLEQDGWRPGSDGILVKDGVRASFKVITNQGNVMREGFATFMQAQLKDLGIEVQPEFIEYAVLVQRFNAADYQAAVGNFVGADKDPDQLYDWFHSKSPRNAQGYGNPELDRLLEQGRAVVDQAQRKELYARAQEILMEDLPDSWSFYRPYVNVLDKQYMGPWIVPSWSLDGILWNIHKWGR